MILPSMPTHMPPLRRVLPFAVLAFAATATASGCRVSATRNPDAPAATSDSIALRRTLVALMDESAAAWNRADLAGHVAMYTDSATMMGANGPITGRESIRASLERAFWREGKPRAQLSFSDLRVWPLGERHAMMTGAFLLTHPDGQQQRGRYSLVWVQAAGRWLIMHDHSG